MKTDFVNEIECDLFGAELTNYMHTMRQNTVATIQQEPELWKAFRLLDMNWLEGLNQLFALHDMKAMLPVSLSIHAFSQARLAMMLGFAGLIAEAGSMQRSAIEALVIGRRIYKGPDELGDVYVNRFDGKAEEKAFDNEFRTNRKAKLFSDHPALPGLFEYWKRFSEVSAHSNVRDLSRRMVIEEDEKAVTFFVHFFETNPRILAISLFQLLESLDGLENVFYDTFKDRLDKSSELTTHRDLYRRFLLSLIATITKKYPRNPAGKASKDEE